MVSITCPCAECKYNGKGHKCTARAIKLSYRNMVTVNEGRVDMWVCDRYELSELAIQIDKTFKDFSMKEGLYKDYHSLQERF